MQTSGDTIEAFIKDSATDLSTGADRIYLGSTVIRLALNITSVGTADGRTSAALVMLCCDSTGAQRIQLTWATDGVVEFDVLVYDTQYLYADARKKTVSGQAEYWVAA